MPQHHLYTRSLKDSQEILFIRNMHNWSSIRLHISRENSVNNPKKGQRIRMSKARADSWFSPCPKLFSFTLLTGKDVRMATQGAVRKWLVAICSLLFFTKHVHCCHTAVRLMSILWYTQCTQIGCLGGSIAELNHCQSKTVAHQKKNVATDSREVLVLFLLTGCGHEAVCPHQTQPTLHISA